MGADTVDSPDSMEESPSYRELIRDGQSPLVVLIAAVGVLGNNVASPVLPAIASGLQVTSARIGYAITAFSLTAAVAIPLMGALADVLLVDP